MRGLRGIGKGPKGPRSLVESLKEIERIPEPPAGLPPVGRRGPGRRQEPDVLEEAAAPTYGTRPERILEAWLQRSGLAYDREVPALGGRLELGGAILDFVVYGLLPGQPVAIRVMGGYYHRSRQVMDLYQLQRLLKAGFRVVDLWDSEIYTAVKVGRLGEYVYGQVLSQAV